MQRSDKLKSVSNVCVFFFYTTITMFSTHSPTSEKMLLGN